MFVISRGMAAAAAAEAAPDRTTIDNLEMLVDVIVNDAPRKLTLDKSAYTLHTETKAGILSWTPSAEYQPLSGLDLVRLGTVGDGNCMLHSILFLLSPTYRAHNATARSYIAREFRDVLVTREADLRAIGDHIFEEIGGSIALDESFEILHEVGDKRSAPEELNIEIGMLIARLYGFNFLAVQLQADGTVQPVCLTVKRRDTTLPTAVIHFVGGATNVGAGPGAVYRASGHYEAVVLPRFIEVSVAATSRRVAKTKYTMDMARTAFIFEEDAVEFAPVKALFFPACSAALNGSPAAPATAKSSSPSVEDLTNYLAKTALEGGKRRTRRRLRSAQHGWAVHKSPRSGELRSARRFKKTRRN